MTFIPPRFTNLSDMGAFDVGRLAEPEVRTILKAIKGGEGKRVVYSEAVA